ncbi:hypothetical protein BS78_10G201300 [Paspalum vaginatum]|nr:hypothetical protein BS78_10G201300 [Paspalum vaginatum]
MPIFPIPSPSSPLDWRPSSVAAPSHVPPHCCHRRSETRLFHGLPMGGRLARARGCSGFAAQLGDSCACCRHRQFVTRAAKQIVPRRDSLKKFSLRSPIASGSPALHHAGCRRWIAVDFCPALRSVAFRFGDFRQLRKVAQRPAHAACGCSGGGLPPALVCGWKTTPDLFCSVHCMPQKLLN